MLKAKTIIRDLKHLKGNKIFGYYDTYNFKESKNLDISPLQLVRALSKYEVDFKKLYKVDFDDVVYDDIEGDYDCIDLGVKSDNSYNWSSQIVFNFDQIKVTNNYGDDCCYITVKFHRYGDIRGNYTSYMVLDMSMDEFFEILLYDTTVYCNIEYKGNVYSVSTNCLKEACLFDIYCDDIIDDDDVVLDIDNLRSKKDIKKALINYLKTID